MDLVPFLSKFFPPIFSSVFWKREIWRDFQKNEFTLQRSYCQPKLSQKYTKNFLSGLAKWLERISRIKIVEIRAKVYRILMRKLEEFSREICGDFKERV
jgi:hypothetical protein